MQAAAVCLGFLFSASVLGAQEPAPSGGASPQVADSGGHAGAATQSYSAFQTYEIHQAKFLQQLLYERLLLDEDQRAAMDRIIAEFVVAVFEKKPKPILIAYKASPVATDDGKTIKPKGDTVEDFASGKVDTSRGYLVDLLIDEVAYHQVSLARTVVQRWDKLRPKPLDGPMARLSRAVKDPELGLSSQERQVVDAIVQEGYDAIPREDRAYGRGGKYEPDVRAKVFASLSEPSQARLKATLDMLDATVEERGQPNYALHVYEESVRLLEGAKKTDPSPPPGADKTPTDSTSPPRPAP